MTLKGRRYGRILLTLIVVGALAWFGVRALNSRTRDTVVAVPDNGGGGKLKSGEIAPFEIRLKHN